MKGIIAETKKVFLEYFSAFLKSKLKLEHFEKKMNLIPDVFAKLQTPKNLFLRTIWGATW